MGIYCCNMEKGPSETTDEQLAALVQTGDDAAFVTLVERYQAKLLRYGRKFLSDQDPIEDVVQDVFIKVYQNINSFDSTRRFSPWIYRIAHNAFVNILRKRSREPMLVLDFDLLVSHYSSEENTAGDRERADVRAAIEKGLGGLSAAYREIIILYYVEELSYAEIADVLHVPIGTVGIRLRRARVALQKHFKENGVLTYDDI